MTGGRGVGRDKINKKNKKQNKTRGLTVDRIRVDGRVDA